ncbi:hypothetical protein AB0J84_02975 [Micromonospora arborensis]|uniref:hypothetical protein n=1 Tax=Micromonospora arborensis TaxID=2116518 RepID=UPI00343D3B3E
MRSRADGTGRWATRPRTNGTWSNTVGQGAPLLARFVEYASGAPRRRPDPRSQLLRAALPVVDGGGGCPGERLDDLRVVVERVERSPQNVGQLLQPHPQLRLGVHPVDVQLAAVEVHPHSGVDLEQVGHPGPQREVGVQAVDRQPDGVDGDLRNVEQDVRVHPARLPLLRVLAHVLPPRLHTARSSGPFGAVTRFPAAHPVRDRSATPPAVPARQPSVRNRAPCEAAHPGISRYGPGLWDRG